MNNCTPGMATEGARALRGWDAELDKHAARYIWKAMEAHRVAEDAVTRSETLARQRAANTPWETRPGDFSSTRATS